MKTLSLVVFVVLAICLAACGGEDCSPSVPIGSDPIDQHLGNSWFGLATYRTTNQSPLATNVDVGVAIQDREAVVTGLCPGGTGSISIKGSGTEIFWNGSSACPPVGLYDCPSVTTSLTYVAMRLTPANGLYATVIGTADGCGSIRAFTIQFDGTTR